MMNISFRLDDRTPVVIGILFLILLIYYCLPKLLVRYISRKLQRFIPVSVKWSHIGLFWGEEIRLKFLSGETLLIHRAHLTSSLFSSSARCLLTIVVYKVNFETSSNGLLSLWSNLQSLHAPNVTSGEPDVGGGSRWTTGLRNTRRRNTDRGWFFTLSQFLGLHIEDTVIRIQALPQAETFLVLSVAELNLNCALDALYSRVHVEGSNFGAKIVTYKSGFVEPEHSRILATLLCHVTTDLVLDRYKARPIEVAHVRVQSTRVYIVEELAGELNGAVDMLLPRSSLPTVLPASAPRSAFSSGIGEVQEKDEDWLMVLPREISLEIDPIDCEILRLMPSKSLHMTWDSLVVGLTRTLLEDSAGLSARLVVHSFVTQSETQTFASMNKLEFACQSDNNSVNFSCNLANPFFAYHHEEILFWNDMVHAGITAWMLTKSRLTLSPLRTSRRQSQGIWLPHRLLIGRRVSVKVEVNCGKQGVADSTVTLRVLQREGCGGVELGMKSWTLNLETERLGVDLDLPVSSVDFHSEINTMYCKLMDAPNRISDYHDTTHFWNTVFYVGNCFLWGHKMRRGCLLSYVQAEWSPELSQVMIQFLPMLLARRKQHADSQDVGQGQAELSQPIGKESFQARLLKSFTDVDLEIKLDHVNLFAVSEKEVFLMERIDCIQLLNKVQAKATLTLTSGHLIYDRVMDRAKGLPILPCNQITRQLMLLPEISISLDHVTQHAHITCTAKVSFLWKPAMHLCLKETIDSLYLSLIDPLRANQVAPTETTDAKPKSHWLNRLSLKCSGWLEVFVDVSDKHRVTLLLDQLEASWTDRTKLSTSQMIVRFDEQEIFVFENVTLRSNHYSTQYRTDTERLKLRTATNRTWEFFCFSCYITFPFKYDFYDCFHDVVTIRKFLRNLHRPAVDPLSPKAPLPADIIILIKKFVLEIKDDPFECKLGDIFSVLMDEIVQHDKRVESMAAQLNKAMKDASRHYSDQERQTYFNQLEKQRSAQYIARLSRFYQGYDVPESLFTFVMENLRLKSLADSDYHGKENVIRQMIDIDRASPFPDEGMNFTTLWCRMISLNVDHWRWQLRDFSKPLWDITDLFLWGRFLAAEQVPNERATREVKVVPGDPWPNYEVIRCMPPLKFYHDFSADVKEMVICHGPNWEPYFQWLNLSTDLITRASRDPSPPLPWWDKSRLKLHGRLCFVAESMQWLYPTSLDPYNSTEFFDWQWSKVMVNWTNMHWLLEGNLDIFCRTASKYDGDCRLLHLPNLELRIDLDWMCMGDPNDHHRVMPCALNKVPHLPPGQVHDTYHLFRSRNLKVDFSFTVKSSDTIPRCVFYTNILKFLDKFKMCVSRVSRPIRRGRLFNCMKPRKTLLGRLCKRIGISMYLPCLDLSYWVSFAKKSGLRMRTGPISLQAELAMDLQPFQDGLIRRSRADWYVDHMRAEMHEGRVWLRHSSEGQGRHQKKPSLGSGLASSPGAEEDTLINITANTPGSPSVPEFMILPLVRYERVRPPPLPAHPTCMVAPGLSSGDVPPPLDTDPELEMESQDSEEEERRKITHEELTPVHRLEVRELKVRWTEENRDLVYGMIDSYRHAQSLKKNLSAQALKAVQIQTQHVYGNPYNRGHSPNQTGSSEDEHTGGTTGECGQQPGEWLAGWRSRTTSEMSTSAGALASPRRRSSQMTISSQGQVKGKTLGPGLEDIPMLAQLLEEVDTAKFYAYCEEEPKQVNVMNQLHGVALCQTTEVLSRNWHVELINSQVMLKTAELSGYVIVSAARTRLDNLDHRPVWKDSQLLTKSTLVGKLECMQYYATVGKVEPTTPDQWLSTADVEDHVGNEDALSGKPEVVGCGMAVGGVVSACVGHVSSGPAHGIIQLQRMISRCSCHVYCISYDQADPNAVPMHVIPPLPSDEDEVLSTPEGANTVTIVHRTLNICTNSLQYHMIVDLINDLLLYVEPQRKARIELNWMKLWLKNEEKLKWTILNDQEELRNLVQSQRRLERELWDLASQGLKERAEKNIWENMAKQKQLEGQIQTIKNQIVERNATLSQYIAFYQQRKVQSQRQTARAGGGPPGQQGGQAGQRRDQQTRPSAGEGHEGAGRSDADVNGANDSGAQDVHHTAEIIRRNEVCFEHARWRMTETDGQIGLADVELRGCLYSKVNRADDSGGHHLELGWVKVDNLCPNCFYKDVLMSNTSSELYTGSPVLRIACVEGSRVGGIQVKEVLEINVAPLVLQVSKQFFRAMMPYFFPDKTDDTAAPGIAQATLAGQQEQFDSYSEGPSTPTARRRNRLRLGARKKNQTRPSGSDQQSAECPDITLSASSTALAMCGVELPQVSVSTSIREGIGSSSANLTLEEALHLPMASEHLDSTSTTGVSVMETPYNYLTVSAPGRSASSASFPLVTASAAPSLVGPQQGAGKQRPSEKEISRDPVERMRERARKNNVFLYIKIPEFPLRLSYKGEKQKNLIDVNDFMLTVPMIEYRSVTWTWLDLAMEVKTRIRKELIKEVIKKKLTLRRLPFYRPVQMSPKLKDEDKEKKKMEMLLGRHANQKETTEKKRSLFRRSLKS